MTSDTQHTTRRQPSYALAAVAFFLAAACFFLVAARKQDLAPWFVLIGGLNVANGCLLSLRARKAAARRAAAAGDRPQAGDRA